jgi:hypothetical protein
MIKVGLRIVLCCCDDKYEIYQINEELNQEELNILNKYSQDQIDIYEESNETLNKIFNENREFCDQQTYNNCDYKLFGLLC